jgi:hypothetical protein
MERDGIQRQHDEAKRISDEVEKLPLPKSEEGTITIPVAEKGPQEGRTRSVRVLRMGDAEVWLHDRPADQERRQTLEWTWRDKRMKERGMQSDWRILRDRLKDRDRRIARQEAKIKAINEESAKAAESDRAAASPLPPGVGGAQAAKYSRAEPKSKGQVTNDNAEDSRTTIPDGQARLWRDELDGLRNEGTRYDQERFAQVRVDGAAVEDPAFREAHQIAKEQGVTLIPVSGTNFGAVVIGRTVPTLSVQRWRSALA